MFRWELRNYFKLHYSYLDALVALQEKACFPCKHTRIEKRLKCTGS